MRMLFIALALLLASAPTVNACSCAPVQEATTAREMSEGRTAIIGVGISQRLERRADSFFYVSTTYHVIDPLGSSLTGAIKVHDFDSDTSCQDHAELGTAMILVLERHEGVYTIPPCSPVIEEAVFGFQTTGRDYPIARLKDCVYYSQKWRNRVDLTDLSVCRHHSDSANAERDALLERLDQARAHPYVSVPPDKKDETETRLRASDLSSDLFMFRGQPVFAELRDDGFTDVTYAVLEDFDQFLPELMTVRTFDRDGIIRWKPFFAATRSEPSETRLYGREARDLLIAFADWTANGRDWPADVSSCYSECEDDAFKAYDLSQRIGPSRNHALDKRIAFERLEAFLQR
ncbi:MAG: hypothetical protein WBG08_12595 [Litorimonas sp.]